ncbi:MAG: glycine/sarcosine/betaine reductase complex selenoprotein A, partial [Synergistaceae bacterium]|nr:glycine/sarcosine/betaine reductase complex selenoprotein A [Synergistaceae bacterium]
VSLGLPVYHVFEQDVRDECDPAEWEAQISMMEMVLDPDALAAAVKGIREQFSKHPI